MGVYLVERRKKNSHALFVIPHGFKVAPSFDWFGHEKLEKLWTTRSTRESQTGGGFTSVESVRDPFGGVYSHNVRATGIDLLET